MKTREQIYGQEAAGLLRDVSMYRALTEMQLLKLYPHKESKIRNLLSYLQKQGRIVQRGEYYRIPADAEESIDHGLSKAVWVLTDFTLIPGAAQAWGLSAEGCTASEPQRILDALADGKLVVALMTKGHFTKSGHFIVLRGVQDEKILVADPASYQRSQKTWDLSIILNEASRRAGAGGPFWIIG